MNAFSKILGLGDKDLQEKANEYILQLASCLRLASAKLYESVVNWSSGTTDRIPELTREIVRLEREADTVMDEIIKRIFTQHAFLPQQTDERYELVKRMDRVIDAVEQAARIMEVVLREEPPKELVALAEKCRICTDLLEEAVKSVLTDFITAANLSVRIEVVREEARDIEFDLLRRLYNSKEIPVQTILAYRDLSEGVLEVAITSEETADFIRALSVRYL